MVLGFRLGFRVQGLGIHEVFGYLIGVLILKGSYYLGVYFWIPLFS